MGETNEDIRGGKGSGKKTKQEKKKILLRLDPALHEQFRLWAERDFRSLNSQIEFLLKKSLRQTYIYSNLIPPWPLLPFVFFWLNSNVHGVIKLDEIIDLLSIDNMSHENLSDLRSTWQNPLQLL